ncbi:hypothetical protein M1P56_17640 [Streptomyces sp. HU2014]|uniref:hypothetical protein n=1 Tax=Streptomyces sp. HU2014 TaxID=2939414 RepID=UPI00200FCFD8|nr:hypothetical protein [Streptomyces sp. HU2014]UQI46040.1 hypothetical protein M1P56_17640 [Streptomyces sp. HU2014]
MSERVRRAPSAAVATALAGLWALLLVLLAGPTATAAGPTPPSRSAVPAVTTVPSPSAVWPVASVPSLSAAPVGGLDGRAQAHGEPAGVHWGVDGLSRVSAPQAHAVLHSPRPHTLPVLTQGPVTGPLELPLRPGEIAGPRQERAPPPAVLTSRRTRGPPFTRSS